MTWLQRYRIRYQLSNSLWISPVLSIFAGMVVARVLPVLEPEPSVNAPVRPEAVQALLATLATSMFSFIVFVSSALLVAVQLASSQLTPRIIAIVFGDHRTRFSLAVFVFSFMLTMSTLVRVGESVPRLAATVAAYSCVASLAVFLYLIDRLGKSLRPSGAVWAVASLGRTVIRHVYPQRLVSEPAPVRTHSPPLEQHRQRTVYSAKDGVILAFDIPGLVALAGRCDCVVELAPQVGDFIAIGEPLFHVYGAGERVEDRALRDSVAVGQERTFEQDPGFAFRILVDIASKGLSPAINDPTTAVLAIDQIHHLLREVGTRRLDDERVLDGAGRVRLAYRTPDWEDFVRLAVTEIRHFGGSSIQIARRLRAMLENLIQTLPPTRVLLLQQELDLLKRSTTRFFCEPEDLAQAAISDLQGVGGKHGRALPPRTDK